MGFTTGYKANRVRKNLTKRKMKKAMHILILLMISSLMLTSCDGSSNDKKVEINSDHRLKSNIDTIKVNVHNKVKSEKETNKVTCTEIESKNEDEGDPILTKTCSYKKYKTISKGYPDYKGRYSYEYTLLQKQENGSYVPIKNAALFNQNKNELLSIINSKIEHDYKSFSNDPESKICFEGSTFTPFSFDQLGIDFDDNKINFHVTFGLYGACMSVDGTIVSFELEKIQKYLND
jgi:hypothetical protein